MALHAALRPCTSASSTKAACAAMRQVTDGTRVFACRNGVPMLTKITATGCAVTALAAAFIACAPAEPLLATAHALAVFG